LLSIIVPDFAGLLLQSSRFFSADVTLIVVVVVDQIDVLDVSNTFVELAIAQRKSGKTIRGQFLSFPL
jgi:hypothetical protein